MEILGIPSPIATLLAALFGGLLLLYVHRHNAFRSAAIEFKNSFVNELAILNPAISHKPNTTYNALLAAFDKHQRAVIAFEHFLPFHSKRGFRKAWETYRKHSANFGDEVPDHEKMNHLGEYLSSNSKDERDAQNLALLRLQKLLAYANVR